MSDFVRQRPSESVGGVELGYAEVSRIREAPPPLVSVRLGSRAPRLAGRFRGQWLRVPDWFAVMQDMNDHGQAVDALMRVGVALATAGDNPDQHDESELPSFAMSSSHGGRTPAETRAPLSAGAT